MLMTIKAGQLLTLQHHVLFLAFLLPTLIPSLGKRLNSSMQKLWLLYAGNSTRDKLC